MDFEKFYTAALSDTETFDWIVAYTLAFKEPPFGMMEQARAALVKDCDPALVPEHVQANILAYFTAL